MALEVAHRDRLLKTIEHLPLGKTLFHVSPPLLRRDIPPGDVFIHVHKPPLPGEVRVLHHRFPAGIHLLRKDGRIDRPGRLQGDQEPLLVQRQFHHHTSSARCSTESILSRNSTRNACTRSYVSFLHCPQVSSPLSHRRRRSASSTSSSSMWKRFRR